MALARRLRLARLILIGSMAGLAMACGSGAPAPSEVPSAATATPSLTPSPTLAPTPSPTAAPTPTPSPTCSISADRIPTLDVFFYLSGVGFAPGVDIELTFVGPTGTSVWGGPDGVVKPTLLRTTAEGAFGPYDIAYTEEDELGANSITASDGTCRATVDFVVGTS